ncbi:metallophosphoesterase [Pseudoclavibacter chungangensis]|uniref:metallophosphoesterase n=1 Tax=Pseudoclavibacter chungangensis TaxID=587635 RepID=UPI0030B87A7C
MVRASGLGLAAVAATGLATLLYGVFVERLRFRLRRVEAPVLPSGSVPIRILHLSDFHLAPWQTIKQDFVRELATLEPDLIVDTGDNLGHSDVLPALRDMLEPFRGVPGVFVYGSNDYYGPVLKNPFTYFARTRKVKVRAPKLDITGLEALLTEEMGWHSLNNDATTIEVSGRPIHFVGVDDPHIKYDRPAEARAAFENLHRAPGETVVALAHAPYQRVLTELTELGADAIFAGHTHGGQVCVPLYGALVTNCDIPRRQVSGASSWRSATRRAFLHVSRGLGTSIYAPIRFACPPEATLVTLTPR